MKHSSADGGLFRVDKRKFTEGTAEKQDLGRFPILHPSGKIPESVTGLWRSTHGQ